VSRDEAIVRRAFARAIRRAWVLAAIEACAWGLAAAAMSRVAGVIVASAVFGWRVLRGNLRAVVRAIDRGTNGGRNVLVTADELLRGTLTAKPYVRDRVLADAARVSTAMSLRRLFPVRAAVVAAAAASVIWLLALTTVWRAPLVRAARRVVPTSVGGRVPAESMVRLTVTIEPPAYTGRPARTAADPAEIAAIEGSALTVQIDARANALTIDHDGMRRSLARDRTGRFVDRVTSTRTGYYAVETDSGARRVLAIVVTPDALPSVRVAAPGRDLVFADADRRIAFEARATDDFGLRALSLQYTRVAGSGETFQFHEGEIPLTIARSSGRDWSGTAARSLADLDLKQGDILVYRASAADTRPDGGSASSDAFFIEISALAAGAADGFTIPQEETRYALSQQMLVLKTERLDRRRASTPASDFTEAAMNLAVEQRMIRAEFVFMLGGEIADEEVEAAQSSELQEGRLQNRGQRDLRDATVAMSHAENSLAGSNTGEALVAERAAIAALQRAFARDRYILRALAGQTDLDPKRRLTGDLSRASNWRRQAASAPENRRTALLQDLLAGFGAIRDDSAPSTVVVLAGEALRADADSSVLRQAAIDLQHVADRWAVTAPDARRQAIANVASIVARELAQSMAGPTAAAPFVAPSLAGAFADAIAGATKR
jgi:hypothetical protein